MEDETGFINLVSRPDIYAKFFDMVDRQSFLCVEGTLQKANDYHSILVKKIIAQINVQSSFPPNKQTNEVLEFKSRDF